MTGDDRKRLEMTGVRHDLVTLVSVVHIQHRKIGGRSGSYRNDSSRCCFWSLRTREPLPLSNAARRPNLRLAAWERPIYGKCRLRCASIIRSRLGYSPDLERCEHTADGHNMRSSVFLDCEQAGFVARDEILRVSGLPWLVESCLRDLPTHRRRVSVQQAGPDPVSDLPATQLQPAQ